MTTVESYGAGDGGNGVVQNSNNLGPMRAAFSPDGASVYKPVMPPTPPHLASATPITSYSAAGGGDGSGVAAVSPAINTNTGEQTKRRRGRPRKYALDGSMAMALQPQPESDFPASGMLPPGTTVATPSGKKRGRPPGSKRKQSVASLGSPGVGFTPHVITVKAGEDVASKIMSFSQNGSRAICILSANGAISNVTLHQAASSGGTVTYEGRFEILSLSGSYMLLESNGQRSRTGGLSVLLAGPDGRVLGGGVAGLLIAAAPVQVVIGGFIVGQGSKSLNQVDSSAAPPRLIPGSPTSRGTLSESSGSPLNQSNSSHPQSMGMMSWN